MKKINVIAWLLLIISVASSKELRREPRYQTQNIQSNAKPNCAVVSDYTRMFPNLSDPTYYWICLEGEENPIYIQCPPGEAFMEHFQRCFDWMDWKWMTVNRNLKNE
uniref:Chitin-binding type-2 domain-containing protein n=1 Tax=Glossina brevipalpis TaxID=37001 RepID=A0A1A9W5U0_9MUSC